MKKGWLIKQGPLDRVSTATVCIILVFCFSSSSSNNNNNDGSSNSYNHHHLHHHHNHHHHRIQRRNLRFFTISSLCCESSPTYMLKWPGRSRVQITCNTSSANHMQHVVCATQYKGTAWLLRLTEFKLHLFQLYFIS